MTAEPLQLHVASSDAAEALAALTTVLSHL